MRWTSQRGVRWLSAALALAAAAALWGGGAVADDYEAYTALTAVTITNPGTDAKWCADTSYDLSCEASTDTDCNTTTGELEDDSTSHWWSATSGSFPYGNIGTSVTFDTGSAGGTVTVTVNADDDYAPGSNDALYDEDGVSDDEDADSSTNGSGEATVRVRSSDLRETATVKGTHGTSTGSTDVIFVGITSCSTGE